MPDSIKSGGGIQNWSLKENNRNDSSTENNENKMLVLRGKGDK